MHTQDEDLTRVLATATVNDIVELTSQWEPSILIAAIDALPERTRSQELLRRHLVLATQGKKRPRTGIWALVGVLLLTLISAGLVALTIPDTRPETDAETAHSLVTAHLQERKGAELSPRERGYVIAVLAELTTLRRKNQVLRQDALDYAYVLAERAAGDRFEARGAELFELVKPGCKAVFKDVNERSACELGYADFRLHRDAY